MAEQDTIDQEVLPSKHCYVNSGQFDGVVLFFLKMQIMFRTHITLALQGCEILSSLHLEAEYMPYFIRFAAITRAFVDTSFAHGSMEVQA